MPEYLNAKHLLRKSKQLYNLSYTADTLPQSEFHKVQSIPFLLLGFLLVVE